MNDFWKDLIPRVKAMRDETAAKCCEDMGASDGTVMWTEEQGLANVKQFDDLIDSITRQVGVSGVDPKCP